MNNIRLFTGAGLLLLSLIGAPLRAQTLPDTGNLLVWLNADTGVTTGAGNAVTGWTDQSSNGNNASQASSVNQPTLIANAINGNAAISFNGSSDYLSMLNSLNLTSGMSMFIVSKNDVRKNYNGVFQMEPTGGSPFDGNSSFEFYWQIGTSDSTSGNLVTILNRGTNYSPYMINNEPPPVGTYYIYNYNSGGNASSLLVDNNTLSSATANYLPASPGFGTIGIGYGGGGLAAADLQGEIAEIIIYNTNLSTTDQNAVYSYLNQKYLEPAPEPAAWALLMMAGMFGIAFKLKRKVSASC